MRRPHIREPLYVHIEGLEHNIGALFLAHLGGDEQAENSQELRTRSPSGRLFGVYFEVNEFYWEPAPKSVMSRTTYLTCGEAVRHFNLRLTGRINGVSGKCRRRWSEQLMIVDERACDDTAQLSFELDGPLRARPSADRFPARSRSDG